MEPNIFVSHIEVILVRGTYNFHKAFLDRYTCEEYTKTVVVYLDRINGVVEVKSNIIPLGIWATIIPIEHKEPTMEEYLSSAKRSLERFIYHVS